MQFNHCAAWSFGKKTTTSNSSPIDSGSPGPGKYLPSNYTQKSPPGIKMGKAPIIKEPSKDKSNSGPSVGDYNIPSKVFEGPKFSIRGNCGGLNITQPNCSPGPGLYSPSHLKEGPFYSLGSRTYISPDNAKNPGPGDYSIRNNKSLEVPSYKFGNEKRGLYDNNGDLPSPNQYDQHHYTIQRNSSPKFSFGKMGMNIANNKASPGPGSYNYRPLFGNEGVAPSLKGLHEQRNKTDDGPGPGTYLISNRDSIPGFKMGPPSKETDSKKKISPGPGDYYSDKSYSYVLKDSPKWGLGSRNSYDNIRHTSPGPIYDTRGKIGQGPKYSFNSRDDNYLNWKKSIPGPADYTIGTSNLKANPGWKIGSERRGDEMKGNFKNNFPGPGQYNQNLRYTGGVKFGKGVRMPEGKKDAAGPGSYHIPCSIVDVNNYTRAAGKFDPNYKYI